MEHEIAKTHEIVYHPQASGALGIAFLAAYATGQVRSFDAIRDTWLIGPELSTPDPGTRRACDDLYRLYCHLGSSLSAAFALANPDRGSTYSGDDAQGALRRSTE